MSNNKYVNILGFNFLNIRKKAFFEVLKKDISEKKNKFIVTANPEIIMYARKHPSYAKKIKKADYLVADGIGIIKASLFQQQHLPERITGYDIFEFLLKRANQNHLKIYLLGSKENVIKKVVQKINKDYPNIKIVGYQNGYYSKEESIVTSIKQTHPDIVLVATGFPKQENFINRNLSATNAIWLGIGGSFDVFSGVVKRAPKFWQNHNIEWLYRLLTDPKRIKRQIVLPIFLIQAFLNNNNKKDGL